MLTGDNSCVDQSCIDHIQDFIKRKYADRALVFCTEISKINICETDNICVKTMPEADMQSLYMLYSFYKFFDNIVFTNTDTPKDNMLGRYLKETNVNEEEAVCLALYHLRCIPQ